ncbi:LacI family DNA-binding transcriptional regulator [Arthrobacter sp. H14]|uniref:LacI family DNA-binding transcriptional regulator n=1 Tax=Arthrobacter sp. H14 TaxID=1312959 RepID=UPI00047981B8|nr:LacI family DNA-binding transcriptional regulator [Arthrobacter sp. H14]
MTLTAAHPGRNPVTRKDVARYAGVSTAVVSYVVNSGPKKVAPATEARVLEAIRVLGYRPNAAARALKLGSTEMLGLVIPDNTNTFFAELSHAIEDAANELGYALLLTNSNSTVAKERKHVRNLLSRQVDGLLLASVESDPHLEQVVEAGIPTVLLNRYEPAEGFASIGVDLTQGAVAAVEHLIGHGHTNIGLVVGTGSQESMDGREDGWLMALKKAHLPEGPMMRVPFTLQGGYSAGIRLVASHQRPTAIFVSSDMQAIGVLRALHEADLRVPEDVAVVSFDGSPDSEYSWPALTSIRQPIHAMAEAAVRTLLDPMAAAEHTIFPTEMVIRQSCGCASVR